MARRIKAHVREAHAICCNDDIKFVVVGNVHSAWAELRFRRDADYTRVRHCYNTRDSYNYRHHWHIHLVDAVVGKEN